MSYCEYLTISHQTELQFDLINENNMNKISGLKSKTSAGRDSTSTAFVKLNKTDLTKPLLTDSILISS